MTTSFRSIALPLYCLFCTFFFGELAVGRADDREVTRVFIFAGQSNMVGSDSKVKDIKRFPPFRGLENAQTNVKFSYCIGRENKTRSNGWVDLKPLNNVVGPELSFARKVTQNINSRLAIIKVAAGGTHLGGDWNPDHPKGFKMYPLALDVVRKSLEELDRQNVKYRVEGFMWHQGENDMFEKDYMPNYGANLKNFLASWRRDLKTPKLKFYIGELCTKTIWGMDLRPRMYAISQGQKSVAKEDPLAQYVQTSHVGVEIGGGVGLHYHYGTLGQLEHGENYADAYLRTIGKLKTKTRSLKKWPFPQKSRVKLFVLAGHRNMEGERAFVQDINPESESAKLLIDNSRIAFKYNIGGGYKKSNGWEPLGPAGYYDTFGPELSFGNSIAQALSKQSNPPQQIAIAKFTHSGSQVIDWSPAGSMAKDRNIYPSFIAFVKQSIRELEQKRHDVELAGVFYHLGENDMSFSPFRKQAASWLNSTITQSRLELERPELKWFVSQQRPTDDKSVNQIDAVGMMEKQFAQDPNTIHIKAFDLPEQEKKLVLDTSGVIALGELMADAYLKSPMTD